MSLVKQQISIQAFVRGKVIGLLGITEERYGNYQMQQGEAYLHEQLGSSLMGKKLAENALFWAWWRNHWHDVDMDFITEVKHMSRYEMQLYYETLHDDRSCEYRPHKAIIQDAIEKSNNPKIIKHQL
jgi:hypothetical protein